MKQWLEQKILFLATIFLLPVYLWRIDLFGFPTNALDLLIIFCLASWAVFHLRKRDIERLMRHYGLVIIIFILILSGFAFSLLLSGADPAGWGIIKSWLVLPFFFALVCADLFSGEEREKLLMAYYFSASAVAIISLGYFSRGMMTYDGRLAGIFNSPNYLAMYLAPTLIILAEKMRLAEKTSKWLWGIFGAVISLALYLTFSYAAWLAVFLALGAGFLVGKNRSIRKAVVILLLLVVLVFFQIGRSKFSDLASLNGRSSLSSRMMIWRSAGKMLEEHWFWGIGPGKFQERYLDHQKFFPPYLEWAVPHPHNLFLAFWLSGGIFSLLGFLFLLYLWLKALYQSADTQLKKVLFGMLVCIILQGLADTTYFKNDLAVIFWLIFFLGYDLETKRSSFLRPYGEK